MFQARPDDSGDGRGAGTGDDTRPSDVAKGRIPMITREGIMPIEWPDEIGKLLEKNVGAAVSIPEAKTNYLFQ